MSRRVLLTIGVVAALSAGTALPAHATETYTKRWAFILDGWNRSSSPVIADIDADGANEIVFGHQDGILRAYEGDGSLKWQTVAVPGIGAGCTGQSTGTAIDSSPAVADIDLDGTPEVVVGVGSAWVTNQNGSVIAFNGKTGAIEWQFTGGRDESNVWANSPQNDGWCEGVYSTPAIGDIDGDGYLDITFGAWDFYIWSVDRFGDPLPGFPVNNDDTVWSSAALFDLDGDNDMEIFIGGDSSIGGYFDHQGGVFRALDWEGGVVTEMWHRTSNEVFHSSPAIGDINGDGRPEAVVGTGDNWNATTGTGSEHNRLWAFHLDDGSNVAGFPVTAGDTIIANPALADLDGDGSLEVVVGSFDHTVRAWHGDGSSMWVATPDFSHIPSSAAGSPVIADLDGDGDQDVAVGTGSGLALLDGRTGQSLEAGLYWTSRMSFAWSHGSTPAIGEFDGERRIVFTAFDTPNRTTRVASYALPPSHVSDAWPMGGLSAARAGAVTDSPCALAGAASTFCDVAEQAYCSAAVEWMVDQSITVGVTSTLYGPNLSLTRAQMVTFLWRQEGEPTGYPSHGFSDVSSGDYFNEAVKWARAENITTGTGPGTFSPHADVTRAQLVTLMWRRAGEPGGHPDPGFVDVPVGRYFTAAVWWAKASGITNGTGPGTFSPYDAVTRGQAAALLHREATII